MLAPTAWAAIDWVWSNDDSSVPYVLRTRHPNWAVGLVNPTTGRLLVETEGITLEGDVTTSTNQNISSIGGSAVAHTNGIQTVWNLNSSSGGGEVTSVSITNELREIKATNALIQASQVLILAELQAIRDTQTNGAQFASVGITNSVNTDGNITNTVTNTITGNLPPSTNAITFDDGVTLPAFGAVPQVKGWPLYSVAAHYAVAAGVVTNGAAIATAQTVIADSDSDIPFLLSATYILNTNCYSFSPQIIAYVFKAAPSALGANGAIQFTYPDWTNCVGTLAFTNRWFNAGTNAVQTIQANFSVAPTSYVVPVVENIAYTNLAGSDTIVFSFQQGN